MKRLFIKKPTLFASLALLLLVVVATTIAFIITDTNSVKNTFTPSKVSCAVVENAADTEHYADKVEVSEKKDVKIKNTGDTDAYIRVAVVVNWVNADGRVWAQKPIQDTDYTITYNLSEDGWTYRDEDGFYYYSKAVSPKSTTSVLITNVTDKNTAPSEDYYLSVEIIASAIQSTGIDGATNYADAWKSAAASTAVTTGGAN